MQRSHSEIWGLFGKEWWSDFMDSLCQFHMVAHKKGAAAMGGDNRKSGGVKERLRQTTAVRRVFKKKKEGFPKMHHVILFWEPCK